MDDEDTANTHEVNEAVPELIVSPLRTLTISRFNPDGSGFS